MSKQVYLPVRVDEDGTFVVDWDGMPWSGADDLTDVWDEEAEEWVSSAIDGPNADLVAVAMARIADANEHYSTWRAHYEKEEIPDE